MKVDRRVGVDEGGQGGTRVNNGEGVAEVQQTKIVVGKQRILACEVVNRKRADSREYR